jgi:hypothetical protein
MRRGTTIRMVEAMPATYVLTTIRPTSGHELEGITNILGVKAIVAKHDPDVLAWRTSVGGSNTGALHLSMGWDSGAAMGKATDALNADPAYLSFLARQQGKSTLLSTPQTMVGFDIRGLAAPRIPVSNGTPRVAVVVSYPNVPEAIEVIGKYRTYMEGTGSGAWYGRMWSAGVDGASSILTSYSVFPNAPALGAAIDAQAADPKFLASLEQARPLVLGRRWLTELV